MLKKILIVEDDLGILAVTKLIINTFGYETIAVSDGNLAISTIQKIKPDLILLDFMLNLVDLNGLDICRKIKSEESTKHIPVILYSASPSSELNWMEAGADTFLKKPYDSDDLKQRIKGLLNASDRN
jgi:DNA-binding response OmpR family regulator